MLIDGIKMACEACIRGHRVSGCNHSDRKLLQIAKKGRPVSQCNHCRHMRKSRSAHVKCDCGERIALMKEQAKNGIKPVPSNAPAPVGGSRVAGVVAAGASATPEDDDDSKSGAESLCQCATGGRCTCALKKEPQYLDAVPEFGMPGLGTPSPPAGCCSVPLPVPDVPRKPRLLMTQSESSLTTFANGHHKPTHKHHGSVHGSSPYSIPTIGHTGHTFGEHNGCTKAPAVSAPSSTASQAPRRIKSEQSSPDLRTYPALQMTNTGITPLELTPRPQPQPKPVTPIMSRSSSSGRIQSGLSVNTNHPPFAMNEFPNTDMLPSADSESGYQFSAGIYPPPSAGWPTQFGQFGSSSLEDIPYDPWETEAFMSCISVPALTNSTSGDEREDMNGFPPLNGVLSSNSSDQGADGESYGLSATSSFVGLPLPLSSGAGEYSAPAGSMPFEAGMSAGAEAGDFGADTVGFGTSDYAQSNISEDHLSSDPTKFAQESGYISPSFIPPAPADDADYLWMAPWSGGQQAF